MDRVRGAASRPPLSAPGQRWLPLRGILVLAFALALAPVFLVTGCGGGGGPALRETDEAEYQRGKDLLRRGEDEKALLSFLRVIDERSEAPESHLEVGLLYLEEFDQPVLAIYHFQRFLELRPEARQSPQVEKLIDTARKEFARALPGQPFRPPEEQDQVLRHAERLEVENQRLEREIRELRETNRRLRERVEAERAIPGENPAAVAGNGVAPAETSPSAESPPSTYVVRPGDTLNSIARRAYGNPARWERIFDANRDLLRSPDDLRVGQELRLPPP